MDSLARKKLLIIDQGRFSALIAKMLSDSFITATAKDGIEAISYLRANMPDLLLVEESIPGDGLRFCELMGMNRKFQDLPIILMSVSPSSKGILRARAAGVNTYLAKPFRPKDLLLRIDSIFASEKAIQESKTTKNVDAQSPDENAGKTIRERLKQIEGLPPFPATHAQILELANSDKSSNHEISEQLQMDPSLLASIFKMVNSSAYGFQKKLTPSNWLLPSSA